MSIWWMRPFAEGTPEENDRDPPKQQDAEHAREGARPETPAPEPARPEAAPPEMAPEPSAPPLHELQGRPETPLPRERALPRERPVAREPEAAPPELEARDEPTVSAAEAALDPADPESAAGRARTRRRRGTRGRGRAAVVLPEDDQEIDDEPVEEPVEAAPRPVRQRAVRRPVDDDAADNGRTFTREVVVAVAPERNAAVNDERKIALFCDLENLALGVRDSKEVKKFDINLVLERLLEKGKIIVKKAYCDWERYSEFKRAFHEAAIELIDIPQKFYSGKNSADIKMVVDAMDLCYSKEHLDTFALLSGDSDFSPLVSKLKENNKYVIGVGVKGASSNLLIGNCDEFLYYEDVWRDQVKSPQLAGLTKKQAEVFELMTDAMLALMRENKDVLWGSMIKQTMQRKKPSFNEGYYGYSTFSELLQDAEARGIIKLKKDQRSGSYIVTALTEK